MVLWIKAEGLYDMAMLYKVNFLDKQDTWGRRAIFIYHLEGGRGGEIRTGLMHSLDMKKIGIWLPLCEELFSSSNNELLCQSSLEWTRIVCQAKSWWIPNRLQPKVCLISDGLAYGIQINWWQESLLTQSQLLAGDRTNSSHGGGVFHTSWQFGNTDRMFHLHVTLQFLFKIIILFFTKVK